MLGIHTGTGKYGITDLITPNFIPGGRVQANHCASRLLGKFRAALQPPIAQAKVNSVSFNTWRSPGRQVRRISPDYFAGPRIQAWRESNEQPDKTIMRDGEWV